MVTPAVAEPEVSQQVISPEPVLVEAPQPLVVATSDLIAAFPPVAPVESAPATIEPSFQPAVSPQQELARLRQQLAEVQAEREARAFESSLTAEAQQVLRDAVARGLSEEDANWMAQRHYAVAKRGGEEQQRLRQEQQYSEGKRSAAAQIGRQYGVDASLLMTANSPDEMRMVAEREKRYAGLERDIQTLKRGQVPAQTLNAGNGSRAGAITVDGQNIDKLWLDYERQHPNGTNPYEVQYRNFLSR